MKDKYLIGEVAKLFNITRDTLVHYDKIGLLSPKKNNENGYRYYGIDDLNYLTDIILLKRLNLSLTDINRVLRGSSPMDILDLIKEKEIYLQEEMEKMKHLQEKLKAMKVGVEACTTNLNRMENREVDDNYFFIDITKNNNFKDCIEIVEKLGGLHKEWFDYIRFTFLIEEGALFCKDEDQKIKWGVTFREKYKDIKGIDLGHKLEYIQNDKYIYTVIALEDDYYDDWVDSIRSLIIENNIEVAGSILGRMLLTVYENEIAIDYYEVYIPIH